MTITCPTEAPLYNHHYGGKARDSYVSREAFARFFGYTPEYIDELPVNHKIFDDMQPGCELVGYKIRYGIDEPVLYRITIIVYRMIF